MEDAARRRLWPLCTVADVAGMDFERPVAGCASACSSDLAASFQASAKPFREGVPAEATAEAHTHMILASVLGMRLNAIERHEPFAPALTWADGSRSAGLADFSDDREVLVQMAQRAVHPVLRARLADVSWLLDRRQWRCGRDAVMAYAGIVQGIDHGELSFGPGASDTVLSHESCDLLRRAAYIAREVGWSKPEAMSMRDLAVGLRDRAAAQGDLCELLWHCELDLSAGMSDDPAGVARVIESRLAALPPGGDHAHLVVELWRLAARAFAAASLTDDGRRCASEAAEHLARQAEAAAVGSPLLAASLFASAITQLAGQPDKRERKLALRHRLVDVQSRVVEGMTPISHPMDVADLVEQTQRSMAGRGLLDKLLAFACLSLSPEPDALARQATDLLARHPLSTLFGSQQLDRDGKVIHRVAGAGMGEVDGPAILGQIASAEGIRRQLIATSVIDVARGAIVTDHYISHHAMIWLMRLSPAVPDELAATFALGFTRFLHGDFVSATYILTPLLEALLRHVLKTYGHDVTTFDEVRQTQEDRAITSLFDHMRGQLDAVFGLPITTDIVNVFLDRQGPHLRHAVAHGLLHDAAPYGGDAVYACWLMFRLCVLPLVAHRTELDAPDDWLEAP